MAFLYHGFLFISFRHSSKDNINQVYAANMLRLDAQVNLCETTLSYFFSKLCENFPTEERYSQPYLLSKRLRESVISLVIERQTACQCASLLVMDTSQESVLNCVPYVPSCLTCFTCLACPCVLRSLAPFLTCIIITIFTKPSILDP